MQNKHVVTNPFDVQDHYIGSEFNGKLLIRQVKTSSMIKRNDGTEET